MVSRHIPETHPAHVASSICFSAASSAGAPLTDTGAPPQKLKHEGPRALCVQSVVFVHVRSARRGRRSRSRAFYIVDAFANDEDRGKHLTGEIAKALMAKAGDLFSEPPKIEKADVLASKVTA